MVRRKTWEEFRDSKLLWFINTILHIFGWAIVLESDNGVITDVYPARVKFRGFPISESEQEKIEAWQKQHDIEAHGLITTTQRMRAGGVSGGRYSYHFVPTAIGTSGVVRCSCGAEFEFQEIG